MRIDIKTERGKTVVTKRNQRIQNNQTHVSVHTVPQVTAFFPLSLDGKVKMKSLRFTELIGFVAMQLKQRHIPYDEGEHGSTTLGITSFKNKLLSAIGKEGSPHKVEGDSEESIKVLIREGERDFMGEEWTIEKVCGIIKSKNNKRK